MRACALLPAVTGNLGKPGTGFLYLNGAESRGIDEDYLAGTHLGPDAPAPISHMELVDCLEDPARSQALFCWNINIAASNPQQGRLHEALRREDLLTVAVDLFPTDTTDFADYVLPAASFLEFDDLVASYFNLTLSAQVKAAEPLGESLPNMEIFRRLAGAMGYTEAELFESDAEVLETVLERSGVGEDFASLAAKGTVPIAEEPLVQFADLRFPTPERARRARLRSGRGGRPPAPAAPAGRPPAGGRTPAPALAGLALAPERQLRERRQDREAHRPGDGRPPSRRRGGAGPGRGGRSSGAQRDGTPGASRRPLGRRPPRRRLLAEGALAEKGADARERERAQPRRGRRHGPEHLRSRHRGHGGRPLSA